jgi:plastocyanin
MVKKIGIVVASVVIVGTILVTYVLSGNMNMGVVGSGNSVQEPTTPIPSSSIVVKIVGNSGGNSFSPNPVEVQVGETVTWINDDSGRHTVTSEDGAFDSGMLGNGRSFSFTFDKAGEYPYFCGPHRSMVGTVVVT